MANEFDIALKTLVDPHLGEWVAVLAPRAGVEPGPATLLDTDLSVNRQADRLVRIDAASPWVLHLEFQSSGRPGQVPKLLSYNTAAHERERLPVVTVLALLRPEAAARDLTGLYTVGSVAAPLVQFRYVVWRVWDTPVADLLTNVGLAPLAVATDEAITDFAGVVGRVDARLREPDVDATMRKTLLGLSFVLAGLRHDPTEINSLYRRYAMFLEESSTYQWLVAKGIAQGVAQGVAQGRVEGVRSAVFAVASKRFGAPTSFETEALELVVDANRLTRMLQRVGDAANWGDLLATP